MSKRLILILALAFVVGVAFAAYAEVQNVKVSGDITVSGVARDNFDLAKSQEKVGRTDDFDDKDRDFLSITRLRVDADLTDNVSTTIRLLNERNWDGDSNTAGNPTHATANRNIGLDNIGGDADEAEANEIDIDLAYVTLKEFLYSPLSLTVGRQELHFGNDLVVGDPDTNVFSSITQLAEGDLSSRKAFDAVRATLDYNPLVMDVVYAKITEGNANLNDDVTLGGLNASYALNSNTTLEGYLFSKVKGINADHVHNIDAGNNTSFAGLESKSDIVNTVGVRAVDKTLNNLSVDAQVAYQFGRYNPVFDSNARFDTTGPVADGAAVGGRMHKRNAMAAQIKADYDLKDIALVSKYSPVVSAGYTYLSGANRDQDLTKAYTGWDPMFENQTNGHIMNGIFAETNMHKTSLSTKAKVTDDITANLDVTSAWFAKRFPKGARRQNIVSGVFGTTAANSGRQFIMGDGRYIGSEIDATLTYDYTEDVKLSLLGGILLLGDNIRDVDHPNKGNKANATELIGSMKVTF